MEEYIKCRLSKIDGLLERAGHESKEFTLGMSEEHYEYLMGEKDILEEILLLLQMKVFKYGGA